MKRDIKIFICPKCARPVKWQMHVVDNVVEEWWSCTNEREPHFFGLPVRQKDWEYNAEPSKDPDLEPWPEEVGAETTFKNRVTSSYSQLQTPSNMVAATALGIIAFVIGLALVPTK